MEIEAVPNTFPSLFWAYTVFWMILGIYIVTLGRRITRLAKHIQELKHDKQPS